MVRALLDGRKSQTRRVVKPQPAAHRNILHVMPDNEFCFSGNWLNEDGQPITPEEQMREHGAWPDVELGSRLCPYGKPGDRLWVREGWTGTWHPTHKNGNQMLLHYKADGTERFVTAPEDYILPKAAAKSGKFVTALFIPRWASRITLEITEVRVQRLQEISMEDCIAEGIECDPDTMHCANYLDPADDARIGRWMGPQSSYMTLWESINGIGSWDANQWVWCVSFRRI